MNVLTTDIPDLLLLKPKIFTDARGFFMETWHQSRYANHGLATTFVQDNLAASTQGVLRGLHLQHPNDQGKLVQVISGEVFDVAVDLRRGSPWFGRWVGVYLSAANRHQFWLPPGFAHGYYVVTGEALFHYKCTAFYHAENEIAVRWNDPMLAIAWPSGNDVPIVSAKDQIAPLLAQIDPQKLPIYAPHP